jgi:hypothetical protein
MTAAIRGKTNYGSAFMRDESGAFLLFLDILGVSADADFINQAVSEHIGFKIGDACVSDFISTLAHRNCALTAKRLCTAAGSNGRGKIHGRCVHFLIFTHFLDLTLEFGIMRLRIYSAVRMGSVYDFVGRLNTSVASLKRNRGKIFSYSRKKSTKAL